MLIRIIRILPVILLMGNLFMFSYIYSHASRQDSPTVSSKKKVFIVSSYHREYLWSQHTHDGLCNGLLAIGLLDNLSQGNLLRKNDFVESSTASIKKIWMDTKHKNTVPEIIIATRQVMEQIRAFSPHLVLLGDDNAANHVGNQLVDTPVPVVFWGINGLPLKYGLLDSLEHPGHNITGVYSAGYIPKALGFLLKVVPGVKTFAVLSENSPTGRSSSKLVKRLFLKGKLPITLSETVMTNSFAVWKAKALQLQHKVDAFLILNHSSLKDEQGNPKDALEVGAWYLRNIRIPECALEKQFSKEGMLCACDDAGFIQGDAAARLVGRILLQGEKPSAIAVKAPERGALILNTMRAQSLGIAVSPQMGAEEYINRSMALDTYPQTPNTRRNGKK
ncbi:MAG: hypothetical protein GY765_42260 [bacterium]|nr:hypothetical protein [bacterium]